MSPTKKRKRDGKGRFIITSASPESPTQSAASTEPPAHVQALGTTELLEAILLKLPMRDLLLSQRVCRKWRQTIKSSITLQRALFFRPAALSDQAQADTISYLDWRHEDKATYLNLNLGEPLRGIDGTQCPKTYKSHWGRTRNDAGHYRVFVNPLLAEKFPVLSSGIWWKEDMAKMPPSMSSWSASWRRMLITQPAIHTLVVESDGSTESGSTWTVGAEEKPEGASGWKMEDLADRLEAVDKPSWLEGRDLWEEWSGAEDLERIVVQQSGRKSGV